MSEGASASIEMKRGKQPNSNIVQLHRFGVSPEERICYHQKQLSIKIRIHRLRVATGPKVTLGHILVITYPIIMTSEDYITYVKIIIIYKNQLICIIVAMATAIYMVTGICPHGNIIQSKR